MNKSHVGRCRDRCSLCAGIVGGRQRIPVFIRAPVCRGAGQQAGDQRPSRRPRQECRNVTLTHRKNRCRTSTRSWVPWLARPWAAWSATSLAVAAARWPPPPVPWQGYAGNQVQGNNVQAGDTCTTTEQRCRRCRRAAPASAMTSPTASPARKVVRMEATRPHHFRSRMAKLVLSNAQGLILR